MNSLLGLIDRTCFGAAVLAAVLLAAMFVLGISEIILRSMFQISLPIVIECSGYLLALVLFLGSGWTLSQGGHIRVTLLSEHVPPPIARRLDILCTGIALILAILMTVSLISYAVGTLVRGTVSFYPSATPLAFPQLMFSIGPLVLALALLARLIRLVFDLPPESRSDQISETAQ